VTLRARWPTLSARWVTLRARWVTLRARGLTLRARWVTLRARWVTLRARWVTLTPPLPLTLIPRRVEFVETTPAVSWLAHARLVTFLAVMLLLDHLFIQHAVNTTMTKGPSVLLYFGFEYVILASTTVSTIVKYAMFAADMAVDGRWESKGLYVFYLELVTDLLHIFVYLVFFLIIMKYYGFPLHLVRPAIRFVLRTARSRAAHAAKVTLEREDTAQPRPLGGWRADEALCGHGGQMRDLWSTMRNFHTRVADFIRYRRITTNMNEVRTLPGRASDR
jgi:hypothetical protein